MEAGREDGAGRVRDISSAFCACRAVISGSASGSGDVGKLMCAAEHIATVLQMAAPVAPATFLLEKARLFMR